MRHLQRPLPPASLIATLLELRLYLSLWNSLTDLSESHLYFVYDEQALHYILDGCLIRQIIEDVPREFLWRKLSERVHGPVNRAEEATLLPLS